MRPSMRAVPVALLALVVAACGGSDESEPKMSSTSTTDQAASSSPTTQVERSDVPAGPQELDSLVKLLGGRVSECCRGSGDLVEFTWAGGEPATLSREPIDQAAPSDPRRGLTQPQYVADAVGTYLFDSTTMRFDCGTVRYTLSTPPGQRDAASVSLISAGAGCERVGVATPTECMGSADDPAACNEPSS